MNRKWNKKTAQDLSSRISCSRVPIIHPTLYAGKETLNCLHPLRSRPNVFARASKAWVRCENEMPLRMRVRGGKSDKPNQVCHKRGFGARKRRSKNARRGEIRFEEWAEPRGFAVLLDLGEHCTRINEQAAFVARALNLKPVSNDIDHARFLASRDGFARPELFDTACKHAIRVAEDCAARFVVDSHLLCICYSDLCR